MVTPSLEIRRAGDRGHFDHGWLDTSHTFSFADYRDPAHMGFRSLRVINEDRVAPGRGFGTHSHRDMEIITYVLEGSLQHRDSMGNGSVIVPGEVQHMSAGTGVQHSEANPSQTEPVHFLQIWIMPDRNGVAPGYGQKTFSREARLDRFCLVASPDGRDGSIAIHQDATLHATILEPGRSLVWEVRPGRHAWVQVARGALAANDQKLAAGDGASTSTPGPIMLAASTESELLVFDLG